VPDAGQAAGAGRNRAERGTVLPLLFSGAFLAALALSLVWLNIERTKLAYRARNLQRELEQAQDLGAKLKAEREHLLSPHTLGRKADALGLGPAKPGRIRRMEQSTPPEQGARE
jgi:hypothetical protein